MMQKIVVRLCGAEQSALEEHLKQFEGEAKLTLKSDCLDSRLELKADMDESHFSRLVATAISPFGTYVYSYEDMSLAESVVKLLDWNNSTLSVAESLTGGMLASSIVGVAGASKHFYEGIVAYDSRAKMNRLGVREATLRTKTAVSRETASEMTDGLLRSGFADIAAATTGYAGGGAAREELDGLVYIAVATSELSEVFEHRFCGSRNEVRQKTANMALFYLYKVLKGDLLELKLLQEQ